MVNQDNKPFHYQTVIGNGATGLGSKLRELITYKDLIVLFVRRDFVSQFKQTILGPLWFLIQPVLTTIIFVVVFGNIAGISTDGYPKTLFYLSGLVVWTYFAESMTKISEVFIANQGIFSKVYFPRLAVPLSTLISNLIKFAVQLLIFLAFWIYFLIRGEVQLPGWQLVFIFLPIVTASLFALGLGLIISALTTKYRDLKFLVQFGIQLLMYATPIVYPLSAAGKYETLLLANPMTGVIEFFRALFLAPETLNFSLLLYSSLISLIILVVGLVIFKREERNFIDYA
ncbi:MAG: ABC transporter permease [Flavobacteriales bacterium]|nr:MAG: ABC transporter permease [Flavobacteriales bacterium]